MFVTSTRRKQTTARIEQRIGEEKTSLNARPKAQPLTEDIPVIYYIGTEHLSYCICQFSVDNGSILLFISLSLGDNGSN